MTGADVKRQELDKLYVDHLRASGYVVLTAEEAEQIGSALWDTSNALVPGTIEQSRVDAVALLTAEQEG